MQVLTDQKFTYRESPAEQDGYGKFKALYGNTLVWNQLVPSLSAMSGQNGTISVANNVATITSSSSASYLGIAKAGSAIELPKGGHKYLLTAEVNSPKALSSCNLWYGNSIAYIQRNIPANTWTKVSIIASSSEPTGQYVQIRAYGSFEQGDTMQVKNWNYFDLTAMGLDSITTIEEFTSLFPLSYYAYNQGSLLSFNGNGIKTVGFNQWDEEWEEGFITPTSGENTSWSGRIRSKNYIPLLQGERYYFNIKNNTSINNIGLVICYYDANKTYISGSWVGNAGNPYESPANAMYMRFATGDGYGSATYNQDICINISSDKNGTYEPYTSSTLSLPIQQYFPDGMDGINDARDYKNETSYAKKISQVDLGSLDWTYRTTGSTYAPYFYASFTGIKPNGNPNVRKANILCSKYSTAYRSQDVFIDKTICADGDVMRLTQIQIKDSSYTDVASFKASLSGVILKYEMLAPLENYGVVDLGTLDWAYTSGRFQTLKSNISPLPSSNANVLCSKYSYNSTAGVDKTINQTSNYFRVYDSSFTDADVFKQAMSGVYLLYEKQNPQGLVYPPQSKEEYPFFKSYKGGTEQLLPENSSVPVTAPILADMNYSSGAIEVTTYPNPEQGGETSGDGWYLVGEEATVNATPNEHYAFNNWVLDGEIVSTDPEYTFEVQDE